MIRILVLVAILTLISYYIDARNEAFLRFVDDNPYVAVYIDPQALKQETGNVVVAVFQNGELVSDELANLDSYGSTFTIRLPENATPQKGEFSVAVYWHSSDTTNSLGFLIPAIPSIKVESIANDNPNCIDNAVSILVSGVDKSATSYVTKRLGRITNSLKSHGALIKTRTIEGQYGDSVRTLGTNIGFNKTHRTVCFEIQDPPVRPYKVLVAFDDTALPYLRGTELTMTAPDKNQQDSPRTDAGHAIASRSLERNLEIGLQFASFLKNYPQENSVNSRLRSNIGTIDLWVAPWLDVTGTKELASNTFFFATPLLIDADISTEPIDNNTISQNRIIIGSEFEFRRYTKPTTYPSYQRYIFSIRNASDRDFKHAEWTGHFEFQPVFSSLNHPLRWNTLPVRTDGQIHEIPKELGFGYQLLPIIGMEMGKIWRHRHLATELKVPETIGRFFFGGTLNLDVTSTVRFGLDELLYIRGEAPTDRFHNYFEVRVEVLLPSWNNIVDNAIVFSFESGGRPPFSVPNVNAIRLGYFLHWDWEKKR